MLLLINKGTVDNLHGTLFVRRCERRHSPLARVTNERRREKKGFSPFDILGRMASINIPDDCTRLIFRNCTRLIKSHDILEGC
jgi:hypothetical protein